MFGSDISIKSIKINKFGNGKQKNGDEKVPGGNKTANKPKKLITT